jgi:IMP dehydrogenase
VKTGLSYNDVCLIPKYNNVASRTEPDLGTFLTKRMGMGIPIVAANMDTVIGEELALLMEKRGARPILHRFSPHKETAAIAQKLMTAYYLSCGVGRPQIMELRELIVEYGLNPQGVCIDIAHGHSESMLKTIEDLKGWRSMDIIAGNVCTKEAVRDLALAGADAVKVGIGPGSACLTRKVTAFGRAQFSAVLECAEEGDKHHVPIIADGGIKSSREMVLALAAGADSVMIGGLFAQTHQSAGKGHFRGQASEEFQKDYYGSVKAGTVPEGKVVEHTNLRDANEVIDELLGGLRSGMTYCGARTIEELQRKAEFEKITANYF